jgi:hypothetical protein
MHATINYVAADAGALTYDQTHLGQGDDVLVSTIDPRQMPLIDARQHPDWFTFDAENFELDRPGFDFSDFDSAEAIQSELYGQAISYLTQKFDAAGVLIFDHTVRSKTETAQTTANRAPVKTVHNDYDQESGPTRMRIETQQQDRLDLRGRPYMLVNIWMPIEHKVEQTPLAFGIPSTFNASATRTLKLIYPNRTGQIPTFAHENGQKWAWYPDMEPGEAVVFKVFDGRSDHAGEMVPHTAFELPDDSTARHPRKSIELRAVVFLNNTFQEAA